MSRSDYLRETQNVAITVLVDNRADLIVKSTDTVKYFDDEPLFAEHGFSALVDLKETGLRILWDAGITSIALMENVKRMKVDLATIHKIALSHGHGDHTAAVTDVLRAMAVVPASKEWSRATAPEEMRRYAEGRRVPVIAHPAAFRERWHMPAEGKWYGPVLPPPRAEWEALGAEIVLSEEPCQLGPGCWTLGSVPRRSFESSGIPKAMTYREGETFTPDYVEEDRAIAINVRNKGLVVLSGCAHSGIVNTVNHARAISGVEQVYAILGGFHMARIEDEELGQTIERSLFATLNDATRRAVARQMGEFLSALHTFPLDRARAMGLTEGWGGWREKACQSFRANVAPLLSLQARTNAVACLEEFFALRGERVVVRRTLRPRLWL